MSGFLFVNNIAHIIASKLGTEVFTIGVCSPPQICLILLWAKTAQIQIMELSANFC